MTKIMKARKRTLPEGEIIPLTFDECFKLMWGNENHPEVTALLISKLLRIPYEEVEGRIRFTNGRNQNLSVGDKKSDKDVSFIVDMSTPYKISLEMNFSPSALIHNSIVERNLYYVANFFGTGLGENLYKDLKATIQFNFNMDYIDKENKKLIDIYMCRNDKGYILTDILKIVHINIAEMYNIWYNKVEMASYDEYEQEIIRLGASIVTNKEEEFQQLLKELDAKSKIKSVMREIVSDMKNDEELCVLYYDKEEEQKNIWESIRQEMAEVVAKESREDGLKEGIEIGRSEGLEQGKKELKQELVLSMYKKGLSLDLIKDLTSLTEEEIKKILHI